MLSVVEILLFSIGASLLAVLLVREIYCFWRWKRSLGRLEHYEWTRRINSIRDEVAGRDGN